MLKKTNLFLLGLILLGGQLQGTEPKKETIFLVHGLGRTFRSMKKMETYFKKRGYRVVNVRYPSRKKKIEELSKGWLGKSIAENSDSSDKVHFITHSLGGILIRHYLQDHSIPNLGRIVMLSPPNQGCHVADKLKDWGIYRSATGPAGQQLGTDQKSVPLNLNPIKAEVGIIMGNRSLNPFFSSILPGEDDGKVTVECAKLKEMKGFLILPVTHTFIMRNKGVMQQAEHFILNGSFKKGT